MAGDDYWIAPGGWTKRVNGQPPDGRAAPWVRWIIGILVPVAAAGTGANLRWSMNISDRLGRIEERVSNTASERMRAMEVQIEQAQRERARLEERLERVERAQRWSDRNP